MENMVEDGDEVSINTLVGIILLCVCTNTNTLAFVPKKGSEVALSVNKSLREKKTAFTQIEIGSQVMEHRHISSMKHPCVFACTHGVEAIGK